MFFRPYVREVLRDLKDQCELIVWTAGAQDYANKVLHELDPLSDLFDIRLFKSQCYSTSNGIFVKDLRIIDRSMNSMLLIDNSPLSYGFQPENGIPILNFTGERDDSEFLMLAAYLKHLLKLPDMLQFNKKYFHTHDFEKLTDIESLKKKIIAKC